MLSFYRDQGRKAHWEGNFEKRPEGEEGLSYEDALENAPGRRASTSKDGGGHVPTMLGN